MKRARYNSSMLDGDVMNPGDDLEKLPATYVIFITENDVLGKNKQIYHIDRIIRETGELFGDQTHIIYVNNEIKDDTPLGLLMKDMSCTKPSDIHYGVLAERVRYFKEDEEGVSSMCKAMEEMREEAARKAREAGIEEGKKAGIEKGQADMLAVLRKMGVDEATLQKAAEQADLISAQKQCEHMNH